MLDYIIDQMNKYLCSFTMFRVFGVPLRLPQISPQSQFRVRRPERNSESGVPAPRIDRAQHGRGLLVRAIVEKRDHVVAAHAVYDNAVAANRFRY